MEISKKIKDGWVVLAKRWVVEYEKRIGSIKLSIGEGKKCFLFFFTLILDKTHSRIADMLRSF